MKATTPPNRLADATSPYLQQHARNPVDWYPWGPEAHELARRTGRPILLSIGYSACHWCHVMAHESFEDEETAALMNELFVNIKVDREERPDLDKIYQLAHQLLAQRPGGWPLTVFLTPEDHLPFFTGTYFPEQPRHGLPGFKDLLRNIARAYEEQSSEIDTQNQALLEAMLSLAPSGGDPGRLTPAPLEAARHQLERSFDDRLGGFGNAPKFPHPTDLNRLLRHWHLGRREGRTDEKTWRMVELTLERMALGGLQDQLGGGFFRYSVDEYWMIPHFEKMLYDNAQLLSLYSDAWLAGGRPLFRDTALGIAAWALREMQAPNGGFYSSLDADSEGEEGRFYLWRPESARALLAPDVYPLFARCFGLDRRPNFEGAWHLHGFVDPEHLADEFGLDLAEVERRLAAGKACLLDARRDRVRPGRDDKQLTAWNALMIKGLARAGRILDQPGLVQAAERALDFIRAHLWRDGRLLASYAGGRADFPAYLDDHAYLLDALLELLQVRWRREDLAWAQALAQLLMERFQDRQEGGFFFTADDHEALIQRPKPLGDEAIPAGNGIAALALLRLGHLLGDEGYLAAAENCLHLAWEGLSRYPQAHASLLDALEEHLYPTETLVIRHQPLALEEWRQTAQQDYAPQRLVIAIPESETELPGLLAARVPHPGGIAYLCRGTSCQAPLTSLEDWPRLAP